MRAKLALTSLTVLLICSLITSCQPDSTELYLENVNAASGLRLNSILGDSEDSRFARAEKKIEFDFPADHGAHQQFRSEWWYLTAALEDDAGNEYGVHFTLFRQSFDPTPDTTNPWQSGQVYLGHLAVTDVSRGLHLAAERFARGHPGLAGVSVGDTFNAYIEDWSMSGMADENLSLLLSASGKPAKQEQGIVAELWQGNAERFGVKLGIEQVGPIFLQGNRGLSEKGPGSASYYYSVPRLEISGQLSFGDRDVTVTGLGWLDREWSTSVLGDALVGWDWFSLQLDDERSIMAFRLRREDGERDDYDHGLLVDHSLIDLSIRNNGSPHIASVLGDGNQGVRVLDKEDFVLKAREYYEDDRGIKWPISWTLALDDEEFHIRAMLDEQRVDLSIVYWEGLVEVLDERGRRLGRGYMELTGYEPER